MSVSEVRPLLRTPMCEVDAHEAVVECRIFSRADLSDEVGALSARQLAMLLTSRVLHEQSEYIGILIDVRQAPPVVGAQTRRSVEDWLALAERRGRRVAILVAEAPEQRAQYTEIARARAATRARVYVDPDRARRWATRGE